MHQRNCADLCFQQTQQDASGWRAGTNTRRWKCLWTEALFLSPLSRASRNVMFVLGQVAACFVKSQTHRLPQTLHNPALFHVPRNIHRDILHHIHCVGGVAKLSAWTPQPNESGKWTFPQKTWTTLLSLLWESRSDRWKNSNSLSEWLSRVRYKCFMKGEWKAYTDIQMAEDIDLAVAEGAD